MPGFVINISLLFFLLSYFFFSFFLNKTYKSYMLHKLNVTCTFIWKIAPGFKIRQYNTKQMTVTQLTLYICNKPNMCLLVAWMKYLNQFQQRLCPLPSVKWVTSIGKWIQTILKRILLMWCGFVTFVIGLFAWFVKNFVVMLSCRSTRMATRRVLTPLWVSVCG